MNNQFDPVTSVRGRAARTEAMASRRRRGRRKRLRRRVRKLAALAVTTLALIALSPWLAGRMREWREARTGGLLPLFAGDGPAVPDADPGKTDPYAVLAADLTDLSAAGPDIPGTAEAVNGGNLTSGGSLADDGLTGGDPDYLSEEAAEEAALEDEEAVVLVWPPRYAPEEEDDGAFTLNEDADTFHLVQDVNQSAIHSQFVVLLDAESGEILAERSADAVINPASMTKVLTLLTAVEAIQSGDARPNGVTGWGKGLDGVSVIDQAIRDYCWSNGCSVAGFVRYERLPVRDLLYGCILPSGADACLALANYVDGSHAAFVERMNRKLEDLGIADTAHFVNCVGLYDPEHHCTVQDMAVIMKAAMDNELCREVLGTRVYRTSPTEQHPDGIVLSNLFIRRIEDSFLESPVKVIGAKTGYVRQSGNCAVSMARREDGREYICVTGMGWGAWSVIRDHTALYQTFCGG